MLEELLEKAKELVDCQRDVKVKVKPLKTSIARVSFKYGTITLDPSVLKLSEKEVLYVLVHELAHLKSGSPYHSSAFWREVERVFPKERAKQLETEILIKTRPMT